MLNQKFKEYRLRNDYTQKDLARVLGVSQVTISRVESAVLVPSDTVLLKFNRLLAVEKNDRKPQKSFRLNSKSETKIIFNRRVNYSTFKSTFGYRSGDVISTQIQEGEFNLLFGDMVGHGNEASSMSSAIEFGFQQILQILGKIIRPFEILETLGDTMKQTKDIWTGPPSVLVANLNSPEFKLSICNKGLPVPIIYNSEKNRFENAWKEVTGRAGDVIQVKDLNLSKGDSVIFFTDGVLDNKNVSRSKIEDSFKTFASTFKGDSKAIMTNLVDEFMVDHPMDDTSLMIISISR